MTEDIEEAPEVEAIPLDKLVAIHTKIKPKLVAQRLGSLHHVVNDFL